MKSILFIFLLFFVQLVHGQFGFTRPLQTDGDLLHRDRIKNWTEIESERTEFSSSYIKNDGTPVFYISREPVNYLDENGSFQPVSTIPLKTSNGWNAFRQKNPCFVDHNGSITLAGITFSKEQNTTYDFHSLKSDTLILRDPNTGTDKYFQFRNNGIKYSYVLQHPPSPQGDLVISERIILPESTYHFYLDSESGFLHILNSSQEQILSIAPIWCYDESGKGIVGKYDLQKINDFEYELKLIIDESFFQQSLSYPITVDPLVIGPTSTWSGGVMPSCYAPNWNVDSLLINVPAQISVSGLYVTSNYYANPFTTTVMADGDMFFSTSCGQSTNFTVAPPTGNTAGTAYLQNFNLNSPLMCCRPQNCNAYSFYLSMHLQRSSNGTTCNSTYLYYDPTSLWPFSAYVEGNTVENYGAQATILNPILCANECDFQLRTYTRYGVPPFTVTHPWLTTPFTSGVPAGCSSSFTIQTVTLEIPNCPNICDTSTTMSVPAPTVTDACGNVVSGWPNLSLTIKPVANVNATSDTVIVCSGSPALLNLNPCINGFNVNWYGHSNNGTGLLIVDSNTNNLSALHDTIIYSAYADLNGCVGDTSEFVIITEPNPLADFIISPNPVFILDNVLLDDDVQTPGILNSWYWDNEGNFISSDSSANLIFSDPGVYQTCLAIQTQSGCVDTICKNITVLPLEIVVPNVISPNGDAFNETLEFTYLEFFESNHITILNRWGNVLYEKDNYQNDWNGAGYAEGVYYFVLLVEEKVYSGYFHLMR